MRLTFNDLISKLSEQNATILGSNEDKDVEWLEGRENYLGTNKEDWMINYIANQAYIWPVSSPMRGHIVIFR